MRNVLLEISYLGTAFYGFQKQRHHPSVQGLLEEKIGFLLGEEVKVVGAGRTDRGVHAFAQICNFTTQSKMSVEEIKNALNALLPPELRVLNAQEVVERFHARLHARGKIYAYFVWNEEIMIPFLLDFAYHYPYPLDLALMESGLSSLLGEHDFRSFAKAGIYPGGTVRCLRRAKITVRPPLLCFIFEGSGFLQHMIRAIIGTLLEIGRGKLNPRAVEEILTQKDRRFAGPTVPPWGLYLVKVLYDNPGILPPKQNL